MKKKLLASICAGALAVALAVPALAALDTTFTATDADIDIGTISVAVKSSGTNLYLNGDGAPYDLNDATITDGDTEVTIKGSTITDTFFTDTGAILNYGEGKLTVTVTMTADADGEAEFAATQTGGTNHTLNGKLYVATTSASGYTMTADWENAQQIGIPAASGGTPASDSGTAITAKLPGMTEGTDPETYDPIDIPGCFAFRLSGEYTPGSGAWDGSSDSASVKLVFTFEPDNS